jgi:hypothetical protein
VMSSRRDASRCSRLIEHERGHQLTHVIHIGVRIGSAVSKIIAIALSTHRAEWRS